MRLVVTGGGTGGHIFPALEVARHARSLGDEVTYLGSLRGQESAACAADGFAFQGFPAEPLTSLRRPRGWIAAMNLLRASVLAARSLRTLRPSVVFSTGGYSAAPAMNAATRLGIPLVIHEQNSVPGRSNRLFARKAAAVGVTFERSLTEFPGAKVDRVGLPIRARLLEALSGREPEARRVLVMGGSQGARGVNRRVLQAAALGKGLDWTHATGRGAYEENRAEAARLGLGAGYEAVAYLDEEAVARELGRATVFLGRGGASTLVELAHFGVPAVVLPLPIAMHDHQTHNARELSELGAATVIQERDATPECLISALNDWIGDPERRERAAAAMRGWLVPEPTARIYGQIARAGR
ncbi:MAG: UDP-N-acetylglucosamine--N-acetylmuramyl-(pentapeptide) pyrophosphoryl-undecaprenol N-acetylglucosamine transferase [Fimbriimonadaceae bacterium]|nr:UDP-N-acetylglucosamine--N-acetylmuramyl-(pentapeptide) pyrophosphoryl-undecaprenol N-acetylglucosamine transferase [Fimbriimonadaceae bacterium]